MPSHTMESLLKDLGEKIDIPELEPTVNNNITLKLKDGNEVVLQKHKSQPYLIISFEIANLQLGRYQENIFREALRFNGLNKVHQGIFGFSKKNQKLYLYEMLPFDYISGDQVASLILSLTEKVTVWKESLNRGDIPTIGVSQPRSSGGIFGIRP